MRRPVTTSFAVLLGYTAISFAFFGWRVLPHPGRELIGADQQSDAQIFLWSFAWFPHAILTWTNPFVSHVVYAPTGSNLAWVTSVPGLAYAFSPVTLLFGPSVSFNVAAVALPALSAWAAYLLCRYVTRSTWASIVGGYLYGFSSYMLAQQFASHLHLTGVFLVPLLALVVLRYLREALSTRWLAWRLALILAFQAYIATEALATLTLALALGLVLAFALVRAERPRIRSSLLPIAAGYALAGLLAAPLVYFALSDFHSGAIGSAELFDADLLNLVVPTQVIGLGGQSLTSVSDNFPGNTAERNSYLGLPALLIVALLVLRRPRAATTTFLVAAFGVATLLSLGRGLHVNGHRIAWLPWSVLSDGPIAKNVLPSRLALYATLAVAVLVAIWISSTKGRFFRSPVVLPLLAVLALVPPVWKGDYVHHPQRWAFFSDEIYKVCIPRDETLLIFPFGRWGDTLLWQAESGFWFKMAEGTLSHNDMPLNFASDPTINSLIFQFTDPATRPSMSELLSLAKRRHVDRIVSVTFDAYPSGTQMHAFGPLQVLGDVYVAPACGYTSLAGDARPAP